MNFKICAAHLIIVILDNQFKLYDHTLAGAALVIYKDILGIITIDGEGEVRYHDILDMVYNIKICSTDNDANTASEASADHSPSYGSVWRKYKSNPGLVFYSNVTRAGGEEMGDNVFIIKSMMIDYYKLKARSADNSTRWESVFKLLCFLSPHRSAYAAMVGLVMVFETDNRKIMHCAASSPMVGALTVRAPIARSRPITPGPILVTG